MGYNTSEYAKEEFLMSEAFLIRKIPEKCNECGLLDGCMVQIPEKRKPGEGELIDAETYGFNEAVSQITGRGNMEIDSVYTIGDQKYVVYTDGYTYELGMGDSISRMTFVNREQTLDFILRKISK
jgi:hypothetical protein